MGTQKVHTSRKLTYYFKIFRDFKMPRLLRSCPSKACHRAKYANMTRKWIDAVEELDTKMKNVPNPRINYEALKALGIVWPVSN